MNKKTVFEWYGWELAKYGSYFGWISGTMFSYMGVAAVSNLPWYLKVVAFLFSAFINVIEYIFNRMSWDEIVHPREVGDVVMTMFGLVAYGYDIWTNFLGFSLLFAGTANVMLVGRTDWTLLIWPGLFGFLFAVGPEQLYIRYLKNTFSKPKVIKQSSYNTTYTPSAPKFTKTQTPPVNTGMRSLGGKSPAEYLRDLQEKRENEGK